MASARAQAFRGSLSLSLSDYQVLEIPTGIDKDSTMGIQIKRIEAGLDPQDFFGRDNNQFIDFSFTTYYDVLGGNQGIPKEDDHNLIVNFNRSVSGTAAESMVEQTTKFEWTAPTGIVCASKNLWLIAENGSDQTCTITFRIFYTKTKLQEVEKLQLLTEK